MNHTARGDNKVVLASGGQVTPGQLSHYQDAAIILPASLFELVDDRTNVGIFLPSTMYQLSFQSIVLMNLHQNRLVGSHILGATVGPGINFHNLNEPVTITFRLQVTDRMVNIPIAMFVVMNSVVYVV